MPNINFIGPYRQIVKIECGGSKPMLLVLYDGNKVAAIDMKELASATNVTYSKTLNESDWGTQYLKAMQLKMASGDRSFIFSPINVASGGKVVSRSEVHRLTFTDGKKAFTSSAASQLHRGGNPHMNGDGESIYTPWDKFAYSKISKTVSVTDSFRKSYTSGGTTWNDFCPYAIGKDGAMWYAPNATAFTWSSSRFFFNVLGPYEFGYGPPTDPAQRGHYPAEDEASGTTVVMPDYPAPLYDSYMNLIYTPAGNGNASVVGPNWNSYQAKISYSNVNKNWDAPPFPAITVSNGLTDLGFNMGVARFRQENEVDHIDIENVSMSLTITTLWTTSYEDLGIPAQPTEFSFLNESWTNGAGFPLYWSADYYPDPGPPNVFYLHLSFPPALSADRYYFIANDTLKTPYLKIDNLHDVGTQFAGTEPDLTYIDVPYTDYFDGWLHLSNGKNVIQGFYAKREPHVYLNGDEWGSKLSALLHVDLKDVQAMLMDIPLSAIKKFR